MRSYHGKSVLVEAERFVRTGNIDDESALDVLFARLSDKEEPTVTHEQTAGN